MTTSLRVLSWNVRKERHCIWQALNNDYDLVGVQEHSSPGRHLPYPTSAGYTVLYSGRAAIYVHSRHPTSAYSYSTAIQDAVTITIYGISFTCVYSPPPSKANSSSPLPLLIAGLSGSRHLIFKDFNLHNPA